MYFKQKNYFLLNKKEKINILNLTKLEQFTIFNKLFDDFIKYHHKKLINENKLQPFNTSSDKFYQLKLSYRFADKFRSFLNILDEMIKLDYSQKYYFNNIKPKLKRSSWFAFKKIIVKLANKFLNKGYFESASYMGKLPIKKILVNFMIKKTFNLLLMNIYKKIKKVLI